MNRFSSFIIPFLVMQTIESVFGQGTIKVSFDGSPTIAPGTASIVKEYHESGMWFTSINWANGFGRRGSSPPAIYWPDNGTAYLMANGANSLRFGTDDGSEFSIVSMDLAEWSTLYQEPLSVSCVGYRPDGSTVTADLVTDGIIDGTGPLADFQTFHFGPEWSGLTRVEIPTSGWSLDNLNVFIPEPSTGAVLLLGGLVFLPRRARANVSKFHKL